MKNFCVILSVFFSISAQASSLGSIFHKDSALPFLLRAAVLVAANNNCPEIAVKGLVEKETFVVQGSPEEGSADLYFLTVFATREPIEGAYPQPQKIMVKSIEYRSLPAAAYVFQVLETKCFP